MGNVSPLGRRGCRLAQAAGLSSDGAGSVDDVGLRRQPALSEVIESSTGPEPAGNDLALAFDDTSGGFRKLI